MSGVCPKCGKVVKDLKRHIPRCHRKRVKTGLRYRVPSLPWNPDYVPGSDDVYLERG